MVISAGNNMSKHEISFQMKGTGASKRGHSNLEALFRQEMGSSNIVDSGIISKNGQSQVQQVVRNLKELCKAVLVTKSFGNHSSNVKEVVNETSRLHIKQDFKKCSFPSVITPLILNDKIAVAQPIISNSTYCENKINNNATEPVVFRKNMSLENSIKKEVIEDENCKDDDVNKALHCKNTDSSQVIKEESSSDTGEDFDTTTTHVSYKEQINVFANKNHKTESFVHNRKNSESLIHNEDSASYVAEDLSIPEKCNRFPHQVRNDRNSIHNFNKIVYNNLKSESKDELNTHNNYEQCDHLKYKTSNTFNTDSKTLPSNCTNPFMVLGCEQFVGTDSESKQSNKINNSALEDEGKSYRDNKNCISVSEVRLSKRKQDCYNYAPLVSEGGLNCSGSSGIDEEGTLKSPPASEDRILYNGRNFDMLVNSGLEKLSCQEIYSSGSTRNSPHFPHLGSPSINVHESITFADNLQHQLTFAHSQTPTFFSTCSGERFSSCMEPTMSVSTKTAISNCYDQLEEDTTAFVLDCTSSHSTSSCDSMSRTSALAETFVTPSPLSNSYTAVTQTKEARVPQFGSRHHVPCTCDQCCALYLSSDSSPMSLQHILPEYGKCEKLPEYCQNFETRRTEGLKSQEEELLRRIEVSLAETETLKSQEEELLKRIERSLTETESLKCREEELLKKIERSLTEAESLKSREEELLRRIEVSLAQTETAKSPNEELLLRIEASLRDTKYSFSSVDSIDDMAFETKYKSDLDYSLPLKKRKKRLKSLNCNEDRDLKVKKRILQPESFPSYPVKPMISIAELELQGHLLPTINKIHQLTPEPSVSTTNITQYCHYSEQNRIIDNIDDSLHSKTINIERKNWDESGKTTGNAMHLAPEPERSSENQSYKETYSAYILPQHTNKSYNRYCNETCRTLPLAKTEEQTLQNEAIERIKNAVPECSDVVEDSKNNISLLVDHGVNMNPEINSKHFVVGTKVSLGNACVANIDCKNNLELHKCNKSSTELRNTITNSREFFNAHDNTKLPIIHFSCIKVEADSTNKEDVDCIGNIEPVDRTVTLPATLANSDANSHIKLQGISETSVNNTVFIKTELDSKDMHMVEVDSRGNIGMHRTDL